MPDTVRNTLFHGLRSGFCPQIQIRPSTRNHNPFSDCESGPLTEYPSIRSGIKPAQLISHLTELDIGMRYNYLWHRAATRRLP